MSSRFFLHSIRAFLLLLSGWLSAASLLLAEPPAPAPLTAEQKEKLKERDGLWPEAEKLRADGKLIEAVAAAEKMLAIEREVFGNVHADVAGSLMFLADVQEQREDFPAARKAREDVLTIQTKLHGEKHWLVTDARLALADVDLFIAGVLQVRLGKLMTEVEQRD